MIKRNCSPSLSKKVGYLSKLSCGYCLDDKVGCQRFPWFGISGDSGDCVFVLDNGDTLVLDNDDLLTVRAEV